MQRASASAGAEIEAAARAEIGRPFRPQGRGPWAYDCLGLVLWSLRSAGLMVESPAYPLRGNCVCDAREALLRAGLHEIEAGMAVPGDVLLAVAGTRQLHLAIRSSFGLIEAHAGLRRVVERSLGKRERWDSVWCIGTGGR